MPQLLPNGKQQFFFPNGSPLANGTVAFYAPGTLTPQTTWADAGGVTPNPNPITLDANGQAVIYGTGVYRQIVKDVNGVTIWDQNTTSPAASTDLSANGATPGAGLIGFDGGFLTDFFKSKNNRVVDTIALLRGLSKTVYTRAFVTGYYAAGDGGGGAYYYDSTDTTSADNGGTIIVASDGGRWKLQVSGPVSFKQFGAKGDGVTDDTAAIQAAVNAVKYLFCPSGTFLVSALTISANNVEIIGDYNQSVISATGTGDTLTVTGQYCTLRDLAFTAAVSRTAGWFINSSGNFGMIDHCFFTNGYNGVKTSATLWTMKDCDLRTFSAGGTVIQINGGFNVYLDRIRSDHATGSYPNAGINITSCGDVTITDSNIIHCGTDLLINPGTSQTVASVYASNTFFDTAATGIAIIPTTGGNVVRCHFENCWTSSHTSRGTVCDSTGGGTINGVTFVDHQANLCSSDGVLVTGTNAINITFLGGEMAQNNGSGISIGPNTKAFYLYNVLSGAVHGLTANLYGLYINSGCTQYVVANCTFSGNTTGQMADASLAGKVYGNQGFSTRQSGTNKVASGTTSVVISHGLPAAPAAGDVLVSSTTGTGSNPMYVDTTTITATQFTVKTASAAAADFYFAWQASIMGGAGF